MTMPTQTEKRNHFTLAKILKRFFDEEARTLLAKILGEPGSELPWFELGPNSQVQFVYRARRADTKLMVKEILLNPAKELGPPPLTTIAGRMNPAGISVFYGALSEKTAIAEVRPFVGGSVVVGCFKPIRNLKLLDLSQIANILINRSIFQPDYEDSISLSRFLEEFHVLIAKPVQPTDEPLEYIPTQAVAEYVSNMLKFDGILTYTRIAGHRRVRVK
jgi:hypothetical protein